MEDDPVHVWIDSTDTGEFGPGERNRTFYSSNGNTLDGTFGTVDLAP